MRSDARAPSVAVLAYHSVAAATTRSFASLTVAPALFEEHLGREVPSFAYPLGYQAAASRRAIREAGFAQACAVGDLAAHACDDRWALPRIQIRGGTTAEALLAIIRRRPSRVALRWAHAKQSTWRAGRRWGGWGPPEARRVARAAP